MVAAALASLDGLPRTVKVPTRAAVVMVVLAALAGPAFAEDAVPDRPSPEEKATICAEAEPRLAEWRASHSVPAGTRVIAIWKEVFCPQTTEIKAGERVIVVNVEKRTSHSVWFRDDGRSESERFFPEESVELPADLPGGEHVYVCGPHPWMRGRVKVEGAKP